MIELRDGSFHFHNNDGKEFVVGLGNPGVEGWTQNQKSFSITFPINHLQLQKTDDGSQRTIEQGSDHTAGLD